MDHVIALERGRFRSRRHYLNERQNHKYFWKVIQGYVTTRELSPITAINYDPERHPLKLGLDGIHYIADVELATKKALKSPELFARWQALVDDHLIGPEVKARIVSLCGAEYMRRELAPADYFKVIKKGRMRRAAA
jgi:hypothetical protein